MTILERLALTRYSEAEMLEEVFARRRCFVCGIFGWCEHREPSVEFATLAGKMNSKEQRTGGKTT